MARKQLTVGDFEDLQAQLLRTREELCGAQARERAASHELGRVRTELADLALYSNLQATRESLLREDLARLHHALERVTGGGEAARAAAQSASDVGAFPAPPTPMARKRLEGQVGSAAAQIARLEVERDALRAALASAEADERARAEYTHALLAHVAHARAEAQQLHAALRERERALLEARQLAAALHVRVSRADSEAAAERKTLAAAACSSEELGAAYRDAQRVAASQHAATREQLRALKRTAARRIVRAATDATARAALRAWRHGVERAAHFRELKQLAYALAHERAAHAAAVGASAGVSAGGAGGADPGAPAPDAPPHADGERAPRAPPALGPSYVDSAEAARAQRLRRWWSAEVRALAAALGSADDALDAHARARARAAASASSTEAVLRAHASHAERTACDADARAHAALGALADADAHLGDGADQLAAMHAHARALGGALADADGTLAFVDALLAAAEQAAEDARLEAELRVRRADAMVRELQKSLRDEVVAHGRSQHELRAALDVERGASAAQPDPPPVAPDGAGAPRALCARAAPACAPAAAAAAEVAPPPLPPSLRLGRSLAHALDNFLSASVEHLSRAEAGERAESDGATVTGSGAWGALEPPTSGDAVGAERACGQSPSAAQRVSWLEAIGLGTPQTFEAASVSRDRSTTASPSARAPSPGQQLVEAAADGGVSLPVPAEALLLKLRHLAAHNGFLRERVSHLECCMAELNADLDKKRTLMRHLYAVANGPLPPGMRDDVSNSVVRRWVSVLIEPTVATLHARPSQRREREIADAMENVLEETLYKNMQLQKDAEALGAQCVRLRRLLAESYKHMGGSAAAPADEHGGEPGFDAQPGKHWQAVAGGGLA